jgi:TetR/AcrR family fatty acid metabolism transcriptional regulator
MRDTLQAQLTATRQQHILEAAARVFAEKGFHATTVKDVALAAGVAPGSIYNYFEGKTALLLGLFDLMTARAPGEVPPGLERDPHPRDLLRAALDAPLRAFTSGNAELFRVVVSEVLVNRDFAGRFRARILEPMLATTAGLLRRTVFADEPAPADLELRIRLVSGLVLGLILQRVLHDDVLEARWDDLPDLAAGLLLEGLR